MTTGKSEPVSSDSPCVDWDLSKLDFSMKWLYGFEVDTELAVSMIANHALSLVLDVDVHN